MIELGHLRIETEASIVDARSKIGALARSLGFDVVTVARMAALVSKISARLEILFCYERRTCHGRRRAEEHGIVNDETKFRLSIAHVTLLPKI